jgi:imidazolonepropionase-like amidohydrolase
MADTIINAKRMFDGYAITENVSVLISDGVIAKIGKPGDFEGNAIDAVFLSPGLIDMHIHMHTNAGAWLYIEDVKLFDYFNNMLLYNGVTTVRDVGSSLNSIYNFKHASEPKPRIVSSLFLDGNKPVWSMSFIVTGGEQAKEIITTFKESGIEWVKAYKSIEPKVLNAIIEKAHSEGLRVAGHLSQTKPDQAIDMGIDTLEHVVWLINGADGKVSQSLEDIYKCWDGIDLNSEYITKLIDHLAISKTVVCPTLIVSNMELLPSPTYSEYMEILFPSDKNYKTTNPESRFTKIDLVTRERIFTNLIELTKKLNNAGVKLIAGTDSANPFVVPGFSLHEELKLLVESGLTPTDALKAATSSAAEVLGIKEIGQIKPGCKADLILLSEYLDSDINNLDKITHVILNGEIIKPDLKDLISKSKAGKGTGSTI